MKILALDTSTLTGSVALIDDGAVLAESVARVRANHSEQLLPLVEEVLTRANVALDALDRIAVGIGPGSFTGVRIAVATAKGLHLASGVALYGVSSLDALAASAWCAHGPVLAALDARRGELYAALYNARGADPRVLMAPCHGAASRVGERVLACCEGVVTVVGDLSSADFAALSSSAPSRFTRAPRVFEAPLARVIAWEAFEGRATLDTGALEPLYVRGSDAKLPGGREVPA
ncbi:MAG: tRNA (adenosine(37)-N6)-threonylcarbamoyltransferase complex dimerization subunit type 1 TsaB [Polyangiales bacterium]